MAKTPLISFRCPVEMLEKIEQLSEATGRSKTDIVIEGLREFLDLPSENREIPELADIQQQIQELDQRLKKLSA
ncbi:MULTISPECIES: ribbon-helix-helix protein, CopG family [unclassified Picosynechococcus]|jgi:predicted transcriptional regulator|uniref:ribbon-helix-helix protein, CopG family n=1 Tax=unclassified Picosynechococcus TaxID=3079910 RepID=UPI000A058B3E|nr:MULTISPECIES: ribbon-helix-helix protein, CopG family [unclassified Picosynechococcus]SMH59375.1 Ribbon-helix-helix protein, copG family [Picosynechococcus sp. OG1]